MLRGITSFSTIATKAGKVKIPVRDTEVEVKTYNKQTGATISQGSTTYFDLDIDVDEAVNEMIDGFDSASVPDGITVERLDSAGYSLGLSMDTMSIRKLEETSGIIVATSKTACTDTTAYKQVLTNVFRAVSEFQTMANAGSLHLRNSWRF